MKITISGSIQFETQMEALGHDLEARGYEAVWPKLSDRGSAKEVTDNVKRMLIEDYFAKIDSSEALLVFNEPKNGMKGYIGGSALMEMAHAFAQGLDIFLMHPVSEELSYADEIRGMQPIVLNGSLDALDTHIKGLPLVYMSTTSGPKQRGVSRAMRRANMVRIEGQKFESGVAEQPMTIEETYEGAQNRHQQLLESGVEADYFVTVEAGMHPAHEDHNLFGCDVILCTKKGEGTITAINLDVEFPRELLYGVPEKYADVGVLIQEKYGHFEKDVYPFLTNNALTRSGLIENSLYNALVKRTDLTYSRG